MDGHIQLREGQFADPVCTIIHKLSIGNRGAQGGQSKKLGSWPRNRAVTMSRPISCKQFNSVLRCDVIGLRYRPIYESNDKIN
jgi:hypothetical protein